MKNKLSDLNNHLFAQLERLNDESLAGDDLTREINRSKAVSCVAQQIVSVGQLALDAEKHRVEYNRQSSELPPMLENK